MTPNGLPSARLALAVLFILAACATSMVVPSSRTLSPATEVLSHVSRISDRCEAAKANYKALFVSRTAYTKNVLPGKPSFHCRDLVSMIDPALAAALSRVIDQCPSGIQVYDEFSSSTGPSGSDIIAVDDYHRLFPFSAVPELVDMLWSAPGGHVRQFIAYYYLVPKEPPADQGLFQPLSLERERSEDESFLRFSINDHARTDFYADSGEIAETDPRGGSGKEWALEVDGGAPIRGEVQWFGERMAYAKDADASLRLELQDPSRGAGYEWTIQKVSARTGKHIRVQQEVFRSGVVKFQKSEVSANARSFRLRSSIGSDNDYWCEATWSSNEK